MTVCERMESTYNNNPSNGAAIMREKDSTKLLSFVGDKGLRKIYRFRQFIGSEERGSWDVYASQWNYQHVMDHDRRITNE
jgi:hypothetical protein